MDINVRIGEYIFNCRAVGIIMNKDRILFQKKIDDIYWALPGGKIGIGETGEVAIRREMLEELEIDVKVERIDSVVENFFSFNNDKYHQYIFCYILSVDDSSYIFDKEEFMGIEDKGIIYKWVDINKLDDVMIKPDYLKKMLENRDDSGIKFISNNEI